MSVPPADSLGVPPAESADDDFAAELFGEELAALVPTAEPPSEVAPPPEENTETGGELPSVERPVAEPSPPDAMTVDRNLAEASEGEEDLFGTFLGSQPSAGDAKVAESEVAQPAPVASPQLLPWESQPAATAAKNSAANGSAVSPPVADVSLPWEEPTRDRDAAPAADLDVQHESSTDRQANSQANDWQAPQPVAAQHIDSRQLAWQLGSRLSYLLLAPEEDVASAVGELQPVADVLQLQLPPLKSTASLDQAQRIRQLLSVGRELGESVASVYDAEHAALVEVAFKSNLLLAVAETRPQLKHSINSSVAAAAVRAGLPRSVWEPWQSQIAESDSPNEMADAVLNLHTRLRTYLQQLPAAGETGQPPVLR